MQSSTPRLTAAHGPFRVSMLKDGRGIAATDDPFHDGFPDWATGRVEKLVARFVLTVGDHEPIRSNAPFFYGSTENAFEIAGAESVLCSVLDDLASIAPHVAEPGGFGPGLTTRADETAAMLEWMDDLGAFSDGLNRDELRGWIRAWHEINTTWTLILETGELDERGLRSLLNFRGWED